MCNEDGIKVAVTVEIASLKKPINDTMLFMIEKTARGILPRLGEVKNQCMGFRPTLTDSLPIIGGHKIVKMFTMPLAINILIYLWRQLQEK